MNITISKSKLTGSIDAPASKSSMQRALAAAYLSKIPVKINKPGHSDDELTSIEVIKSLGCEVKQFDDYLLIKRGNGVIKKEINFGESGLAIRMFLPIIALSNDHVKITGNGSLLNRPMGFFDNTLPQLDVHIKSTNGKPPLKIQGPMQIKNIEIDGSLSSQFLTGLLMSYASSGIDHVSIKVKNLKSKPYIDLTLDVIKKFGLGNVENKNYEEFFFHKKTIKTKIREYTIERDWSSAAFLLVAGAIAGNLVVVNGLELDSKQADSAILDVLVDAGVTISMSKDEIKILDSKLKPFTFDATDCPDLFPPIVALAMNCNGVSKIKGVRRLLHKESNRAESLQMEFGKLGTKIDILNDYMFIHGGSEITGTEIDSHNDHRIAMSCAIAALNSKNEITIKNAECVNKSYPDFFIDIQNLGANIK